MIAIIFYLGMEASDDEFDIDGLFKAKPRSKGKGKGKGKNSKNKKPIPQRKCYI